MKPLVCSPLHAEAVMDKSRMLNKIFPITIHNHNTCSMIGVEINHMASYVEPTIASKYRNKDALGHGESSL